MRLITVSAVDSVVVVTIDGRESEGATVNLLGRSVLVLDDGTRLDEMSGDVDGRSVELRFNAVPSGRTIAELLLTGVALSRQLPGLAEEGDRTMVGAYALAIPPALIEPQSSPKIDVQASAPFGPGTLHVSEVIRDSDQVVIRGSITGFTERQIQEFTVAGARLHLGDSSEGLVSGRAGFGDGLRRFELRFAIGTEAESAVLEFVLTTTPVPFEPDEDLASYVGSTARLSLPIPSLPR